MKVYSGKNGMDVDWTTPDDVRCPEDGLPIRGILKCFIVPPLRVKNDIPVMPFRTNLHLLFPICRTCAEKFPEGLRDDDYSCEHFDDESRGWMATTAHPELLMVNVEKYLKIINNSRHCLLVIA